MKKAIVVIAAFLVLSVSTSCAYFKIEKPEAGNGNANTPTPAANDNSEIDDKHSDQTSNELSFDVLDSINELSEELQNSIEELKKSRGFARLKDENGVMVMVSMGEKPTGGYAIVAKKAERIADKIKITVEETEPGKDDAVTMAITYPYTIIRIKQAQDEEIEAVNQKGEKFEQIRMYEGPGTDIEVINDTGIFVGRIDGSSIEVTVKGEPLALRHDEKLESQIDKIQENDKVSFAYYKNEHGQNILINIDIEQ